jgi:uncharacterized protein (TIGR00299 family) protein
MNTLYLECNMGAAGDMLMGALLELLPNRQDFIEQMNSLGLPGVAISAAQDKKCGVVGTHVTVAVHGKAEHNNGAHERHHANLHSISHMIQGLSLPAPVRQNARAVYQLLAEAEAHVHGCPVEQIHFHEVGTLDAVADITGVCLALHWLAPEKVLASPVHVGAGQAQCAHGSLPVPAPATAHLLRGAPMYGGAVQGELCTPTGAALLAYFVEQFGPMPAMAVEKIGYGTGSKDFAQANCVRAFLGKPYENETDQVLELCCNLDDMTGEGVGFALEELLARGALEAFTTAVGMKKSRPGVLLTCLCRREDRDRMLRLLFRHTTTLGVRETPHIRYRLTRSELVENGIHVKYSHGYGVCREKPEYEDLAAAARAQGASLAQLEQQWREGAHDA